MMVLFHCSGGWCVCVHVFSVCALCMEQNLQGTPWVIRKMQTILQNAICQCCWRDQNLDLFAYKCEAFTKRNLNASVQFSIIQRVLLLTPLLYCLHSLYEPILGFVKCWHETFKTKLNYSAVRRFDIFIVHTFLPLSSWGATDFMFMFWLQLYLQIINIS